jgi:hypothetical protein
MLQCNWLLVSVVSNILTHPNSLILDVCHVSRIKANSQLSAYPTSHITASHSLSLSPLDLCVNFQMLLTSYVNIMSHFILEINVGHSNVSNSFQRLKDFPSIASGAFQPSRNKYHEV